MRYLTALLPSLGSQHMAGPLLSQGKSIFVNPYYGDGNGKRPDKALTTLASALAKAEANKNDVIHLLSASNTAAYTTDYQSATLDWSYDLTHLIGVGAGNIFSPRSRVSLISTYVTASNLFTLSANGCKIANINFFAGVADTHPTGCMNVTGNRNHLFRCHIAGIGNDLNDIAGAYSLRLAGAENLFEECVIGLDTIDRGSAANSEIYIAAGGLRNVFKNCIIISRLQHSTNSPQVRIAGGAMGNPGPIAVFDNCLFINTSTNYGYPQTYVIVHTAAPTAGVTILKNCSGIGATNWGVAGNHLILHNSATNSGYTDGVGYSS